MAEKLEGKGCSEVNPVAGEKAMGEYALMTGVFPVDGSAITCGNRADLPKKQRRHDWADMGRDFDNQGEKGIVETDVRACMRCGRDSR